MEKWMIDNKNTWKVLRSTVSWSQKYFWISNVWWFGVMSMDWAPGTQLSCQYTSDVQTEVHAEKEIRCKKDVVILIMVMVWLYLSIKVMEILWYSLLKDDNFFNSTSKNGKLLKMQSLDWIVERETNLLSPFLYESTRMLEYHKSASLIVI